MLLAGHMEAIHLCHNKWRCISIQKLVGGSNRAHSRPKFQVANQGTLLVTHKTVVLNQVQTASYRMRKCSPSPNYQSAWSSKRSQLQAQTIKPMKSVNALNFSHVVTAWLSLINSTIPLASWLSDHSFSMIIHTLIVPRSVLQMN